MNNWNRKQFLQNVAMGLSVISLPSSLKALMHNTNHLPVGAQLWSVKEDLAKDLVGTIKALGKMGYNKIETFEGKEGFFWGKSNKEFLKIVNDANMNLISAHCNVFENIEKKAAEAAEVGIEYLVCPWLGLKEHLDDYKKIADQFNKIGEICKKNAVRFAYHNHDYGFQLLEGEFPQDVLMRGTDKELVDFEMDMYWVKVAEHNPIEWMKKYPSRFSLCHIKDREKNAKTEDKFASCILGNGNIDYSSYINFAKQNGMKHFIIEQEKFAEGTPLSCMQKSLENWKQINI